MKSERAKRFIDDTSIIIEADGNRVISKSTVVDIWNVYMAINIAEQEAETRMRIKAFKAYCLGCAYYENGECTEGADRCDIRDEFIKAMNEE